MTMTMKMKMKMKMMMMVTMMRPTLTVGNDLCNQAQCRVNQSPFFFVGERKSK